MLKAAFPLSPECLRHSALLPASVAVKAARPNQEPLMELPDFAVPEQTFLLPSRSQSPPPSLPLSPHETALTQKLLCPQAAHGRVEFWRHR